jgi:perosamine synthetase
MLPVFEPSVGEAEAEAVAAAVLAGEISGSFGTALPEFEREFADYIGTKHGVAVSSGTTALHLAVAAGEIGPGDEVLVSSSTNIATALAAYHNGAVPVPIDSEPQTWNLDLDLIEGQITERTRAIIPVHLFGHPVDMETLLDLAAQHDLLVIEDCAESHGARCRDRATGAWGDMGCFSFYANKVITTGEGGMVVTDDDDLAERLRSLRNLAFGSPRFLHRAAGFNFRMANPQAAMGCIQLRKIDRIIEDKRRVANTYRSLLDGLPGISMVQEPPWARSVYWMVAIRVADPFPASRDELMDVLAQNSIGSRTGFCPMNQQPFLREQSGFREVACPVADDLWETTLYLPSSIHLRTEQIERVCDVIRSAN